MKKFNRLFLAVIVSSAFFASCSNDDDNNQEEASGNYKGGLFILNEGKFETPNGSVSYLSDNSTLENNIFSLVNPGKVTGDTAQNIGFQGDNAYVVVNASNKIEVVNRYTFKSIATITTGLKYPRYISFANGKGYVTNWGDPYNAADDYVAVIDLASNTVTSSIPVIEGPEKIVENNGKLYIAQKGGYGQGNSLTVINAATNTVAANFAVGDVPTSLVKDNGALYILCAGRPSYAAPETAGKLVKVDLSTNTVTSTLNFADLTHPGFLDINDSKFYYTVGNNIYTAATSAASLPTTPLFKASEVKILYGFAVKNNNIYIGDAVNYTDPGYAYIYSLTGTLNKTLNVGVSPNGFYFNN